MNETLVLVIKGVAVVSGMVGLVLSADSLLRRRMQRIISGQWTGSLITERVEVVDHGIHGGMRVTQEKTVTKVTLLRPSKWWKCVLPWPGKKKWAETVLAKVALLGATPEYQAVSAWDWDEAWVIEVDDENIIASSNKIATALAYLKHRGIDEA